MGNDRMCDAMSKSNLVRLLRKMWILNSEPGREGQAAETASWEGFTIVALLGCRRIR